MQAAGAAISLLEPVEPNSESATSLAFFAVTDKFVTLKLTWFTEYRRLTFLKETGSKKGVAYLKKMAERSEVIKMALQNLEKISADEAMRYKYLEREMARRDEISRLHYAETKGMEKGMENVAKAMLAEGEAMEKISRYTGLTKKELERL